MAKRTPEVKYFMVRDWLEEDFVLPGGKADHLRFMNHHVAKMFQFDRESEIDETWIMRTLLGEVEEGRIQYGEALTLKDMYPMAVRKLRHFFTLLDKLDS